MNKIDKPVFIPSTPIVSVDPDADIGKWADRTPRQIIPGNAISDLVGKELAELNEDALAETQEDMGFVLGGRMRELARGNAKSDTARARTNLLRLVEDISAVEAVGLDDLLGRFGDLANHANPFEAMREAGLDSGQMALLLGIWLTDKNLTGGRRKRLEEALLAVMGDEEWELKLFAQLEFGKPSPAALAQLKALYQRAGARHTSLSQWFAELKSMPDSKRKLKALLRALAFELSSQGAPIEGNRLVAVIMDLRRILLFFGFEEHARKTTQVFPAWGMNADQYMSELLQTIDQVWVSMDWFSGRVQALGLAENLRYGYGRAFTETMRLLSRDCFKEDMQRDEILQAIKDYLEELTADE
ncbi:TyeA family type III secretion system gatekeeper subunit [Chitinimonas arctica]|uniref:TyeA family type III secretion system gatekeeper subunit n=1 Tax=Chitinimonas arctica TaxID=2594795 RepID=A0A516SA91_9NEIS|nr:TyeA family type III secretion system gatekeeper subunit [Chitinimonas arctica]QDQ25069.1 TyeA family type III secretion system gatekeeper subunit [Chitinimonas arctica]